MRGLLLAALVLLAGCTSVGKVKDLSAIQPEKVRPIRACFFVGPGVSDSAPHDLAKAWNDNEGAKYGLPIVVASVQKTTHGAVSRPVAFIYSHPYLAEGCDRNIGLVGVSEWDLVDNLSLALGAGGIQMMGAAIGSHMWLRAIPATPVQLLVTPTATFRHEMHHVLGCGHDGGKDCGERIAETKAKDTGDVLPITYPLTQKAVAKAGKRVVENDRATYNNHLCSEICRK